ncbi:MAG: ADP-ribosyl-[dinitrogen reductase] hydrolase [Pseudomonas sp.]|jgi:ADP-ribosyl-[dinitrogen reductase] hydrolase
MSNPAVLKGSCLCRAIGYEIDRLNSPTVHCHCLTCQKAHAAAFASTAGVLREHFRWTRGQEKLASFASSPDKFRHFCSVCGSHLIAQLPNQAHVIVRVATLDDDPQLTPTEHLWTEHARAWLGTNDIPCYLQFNPHR